MSHYLPKSRVMEIWDKRPQSLKAYSDTIYQFYRSVTEATWQVAVANNTRLAGKIGALEEEITRLKQNETRMKREHEQELSMKYSEGYYDGLTKGRNE